MNISSLFILVGIGIVSTFEIDFFAWIAGGLFIIQLFLRAGLDLRDIKLWIGLRRIGHLKEKVLIFQALIWLSAKFS